MPIDYKRYPPNWKTELVPAVRIRSKGLCECCKLKNGQTIYSIQLSIRVPETGRYKLRAVWFRDLDDAVREACGQRVREVKVILTVAHLDHDELNHDVTTDRLKDLCQCCHLRYDAKEKYRRTVESWKK